MGLAEFLNKGVQGAMGIQDTLDRKRREAEQLGQATVNAAKTKASGIENAATIRAKGTAAIGNAISDIGTTVYKQKAATKQAQDKQTQDLLTFQQKEAIKFEYNKELERLKATGKIGTAKKEEKLRTALNVVADDWTKSISDYKDENKDFSEKELADAYNNIKNRIKDTGLQDTEFAKGLDDQFVAQITSGDAGLPEDAEKQPIFKNNPELLKKAQVIDLEKKLPKTIGGILGMGSKPVTEDVIVNSFEQYLKANNQPKATTENYIEFLKAVNKDKSILVGA